MKKFRLKVTLVNDREGRYMGEYSQKKEGAIIFGNDRATLAESFASEMNLAKYTIEEDGDDILIRTT